TVLLASPLIAAQALVVPAQAVSETYNNVLSCNDPADCIIIAATGDSNSITLSNTGTLVSTGAMGINTSTTGEGSFIIIDNFGNITSVDNAISATTSGIGVVGGAGGAGGGAVGGVGGAGTPGSPGLSDGEDGGNGGDGDPGGAATGGDGAAGDPAVGG